MITRDQLGQIDTSYTTDGSVIGGDTSTDTGGDDTTGGSGDGGEPSTPIDIGDVETSSVFLAGPTALIWILRMWCHCSVMNTRLP